MSKESQNLVKRFPVNRELALVTIPRKKAPSKKQYQQKLETLSGKVACLEQELKEAHLKIEKLEQEVKITKKLHLGDKKRIANLPHKLLEKNKRVFSHSSLIYQTSLFQYLRGLTTDQLNIVLQCSLSHIHLIPYPDSAGGANLRKLDTATQLMAVLAVCRHRLHQGFIELMVGLSKATIQRIFIGWVIFLATLFNEIELSLRISIVSLRIQFECGKMRTRNTLNILTYYKLRKNPITNCNS